MITILRPKLHNGQKRIINSPARFKVASCGRRFGKTKLAIYWLTMREGGAVSGKPVAFFAPTYKLLLDVWTETMATLKSCISRANKMEMRITLTTGGSIDFWTLEDPDAGRGRKYARIVIDEAAHARYLKNAWERAISPTLTDYKGEAWFISTPNGINFFHDLFQRGATGMPGWESFQMPTIANPYIDPEEVESRKSELPELVYRQEYLAEFVTFGAGLIKPDYLIPGESPAELPVVLGVDLAISEKQTADYTSIVALSRNQSSGMVYIREAERFRGQFNEVLNRIISAAIRHKAVLIAVEQTQYQAAVIQELTRKTKLPVRGVRPDKDKLTRFMPILTRFEQLMVRHDQNIPRWYLDELLAFPEGEHDDGVDATSIAFNALPSIEYKALDYSLTVRTSA